MPSIVALQAGAAAGFVLLLFVLFLVITIGIIAWVYQDAQSNSSQSAALWALVAFFAPFLGLVLYVLVGRDRA